MVDIFITDSRKKFEGSSHSHRILYLDGFIGDCNFISKVQIDEFNDLLVGIDDEANRLMLAQLDRDVSTIVANRYVFSANQYISCLSDVQKATSLFFNFHKHFLSAKYLFQLVFEKFLEHFKLSAPMVLALSEKYCLTQSLSFKINSASYYQSFKNVYLKVLIKQVYYFLKKLFYKKLSPTRTNVAIFLYDIHNEFDLFERFIELVKKQNKLAVTIVVVDSGNPQDKKVDPSIYAGGNVSIIELYKHKANLLTNYSSFYNVCEKIDPLYSIFKKARFSELEDIQYGFVNNVISHLSPDVCMYVNVQEFGRVVANVSSHYNIPSICVEYSFFFDTYNIEKRIKFHTRACISEVTVQNWIKHNDPTPHHEIIGFCKIDNWQEKLTQKKQAINDTLFDNNNRTIFFASTWAPNPNSPLLTEKVKIVEQLSEICAYNNWNLIVKKHPSEFDGLIDALFKDNKHKNQRVFEHHEMPLFDCIYHSDFVCTQNSSVFVEALYLNKPFSYISINAENRWASLSYFSREKEVGTFGSVEDYGKYVLANAGDEAYQKLQADFLRLQTKFLYKTDGKASERLLELASSFVK